MSVVFKRVFLLLILFSCWEASAQKSIERGYPFIVNYTHKDFHASSMNYGVSRDSKGLFYAANEDGVLIYDGYHWELIPIADNKPVYWVEVGADDLAYVGSTSEFGYLSVKNGHFEYVSLLNQIDEKFYDFESVWEVSSNSEKVVFRSRKYLFVKNELGISVIQSKGKGFDVAYSVNDDIYAREVGIGLGLVKDSSLQLVPGGDYFANIKLNMFLPYPDNGLLIASRHKGLFILRDGRVSLLKTAVDSLFESKKIYHGCVTQNGHYAFALLNAGVAIIDSDGALVSYFDHKMGLPNNQTLAVAALDSVYLWLSTGKGLSKIRYDSPLTYFDNKLGLKDWVTDIKRFADEIFVSTYYGLFKLTLNSQGQIRAVQANRQQIQEVHALGQVGDKYLVGSQSGIFQLSEQGLSRLVKRQEVLGMKVSEDESKIYVSINEGHFGVYTKTTVGYELTILDDFTASIKTILDFDDHVVLVTNFGQLHIIEIIQEDSGMTLLKKHSYELGNFDAIKSNDEIMVFTPEGSSLITLEGRVHANKKMPFFENVERIDKALATEDDHIWVCYENEQRINYCEQIYLHKDSLKSCNYKFKTDYRIASIYSEKQGISWFGGAGGMVRYDSKIANQKSLNQEFKCLLSRAVFQEDSVLFNWVKDDEDYVFDEENVALSFSCYTNQVSQKEETVFQYKLEGDDSEWSNWTEDPVKVFTHLNHGDYTFKARAKNASNIISDIAEFSFTIKTPFYKSIYAWGLYVTALIGLIYLIVVSRLYAVKVANRTLEEKVKYRTREVEQQKEVLDQTNRTKDQLFSIIGHDLRSPLNSLQSLTELIHYYREEKNKEKVDEMLGVMTMNVKNLRNLLDNLLAWTLNQSGRFSLRSSAIEIRPLFEEVMNVLQDAAKSKNISFSLNIEVSATYIGDRNSLSVIIRNLLSNAIKFTEEGGKILIHASASLEGLEFEIQDTGIGVSPNKINDIFDLSHSSYGTAMEKGTGLGLTLVKEFVDMNSGRIYVESELGVGTKFSVFLPKLNK